ncbi:hypothetical protein [Pseudogemmobacter sonorensis]|uniref:hypothetical protein n=1 Tax=Pseudogemmobacter sonorensis TaxID=2989681 RepID=UPI003676AD40
MSAKGMDGEWQLVLICWGTKYGPAEINAQIRAARAGAHPPARVVLITDRPREGLAPMVEARAFPPEYLAPELIRGGCQAKLAMFDRRVLPADLPAIFVDLDTVVMGDLSRLLSACRAPQEIALLQSAILPFGALARLVCRLSGGRRYARGNSSVVVWHPAHCGFVAERFWQEMARHPGFGIKPLRADERFISWVAQPVMRAVPRGLAVKFPTEFMFPWLWFGRAYGALPWVRARREGLVAITLPGEEVKAEVLLSLPEGAVVVDRKGRRMEWSDRYLGPVRQRLLSRLRADLAPEDSGRVDQGRADLPGAEGQGEGA